MIWFHFLLILMAILWLLTFLYLTLSAKGKCANWGTVQLYLLKEENSSGKLQWKKIKLYILYIVIFMRITFSEAAREEALCPSIFINISPFQGVRLAEGGK